MKAAGHDAPRSFPPAALPMARPPVPDITHSTRSAGSREPTRPDTGPAGHDGARSRSMIRGLIASLRPPQWTKNLVVLLALLFGQRLTHLPSILESLAAFVIFCGLSGVVYLINDVMDREADRRHPIKCHRPIASGVVPVQAALTLAAVLSVAALAAAFALRPLFGVIALSYVILLALYSGPLKHIVIIDVLTIAIGFMLRAAAGAVVIAVEFGAWLYMMTILLSLFLALSKRRHELVLLADGATGHRRILQEYSPYLLDQMIAVVTASTLVAYAIFTVSPDTVAKFHTERLWLTLPFPLYGIFRYLYLVHRKEGGGNPSDMLLADKPLLSCVALWGAVVALLIYGPSQLLHWSR
jgi:4-hydroxybenzoate polyprenyltransferase